MRKFPGRILLTVLIALISICGSWTCHRERLADLVIDNIGFTPANPGAGQQVRIKVTIRNKGVLEAGPSVAAIRVGGEAAPARFNIPPLPPRRIHTIQREEMFNVPQDYRITVYADFTGKVTESDERNEKVAHFSVK